MFEKILIANRGEIACRIIRTARRLGIGTVAVFSDVDRHALHVEMADEAIHIGASPAADSYLRADRIVAAARETGVQAIHPGYGFLAENADFVDRVTAAGLVFIGPSAAAIRAMGLKDAAKRLMEEAGVPVVPGYHGTSQDAATLAGKALEIGYPVLVKARAGGGGKGMRKVDRPDEFAAALASARREAKSSFGDDGVIVEKFIEKPRHIEVQVFGDNFGGAVHLFERDCSAQRRHQKVIEESPAPGMTEEMRQAMTAAAVKAARAIAYAGAGTIEFIVDASEGLRPDRFWFMEMNTRLQVEHPVTEMVTGEDLVEWQLRVAAGERLPKRQEELSVDGHAIEARIYAEDPGRGFLPAIGTLHHLSFPAAAPAGAGLRVESGVRAGDAISPHYDPMIAKLVVKAADRKAALAALHEVLDKTEVAGSTANVAFLAALAGDSDFAAGDVDTGLISRKQDQLTKIPPPGRRTVARAALAAAGAGHETSDDPWDGLRGYAHFHGIERRVALSYGGEQTIVRILAQRGGGFLVGIGEGPNLAFDAAQARAGRVVRWPGHVTVFDGAVGHSFTIPDPVAAAEEAGGGTDSLPAPMPGMVKVVLVAEGDVVVKGQPLVVLEAMKMEHSITAPHAGEIAMVVKEGRQVTEGTVLVRFAVPPVSGTDN